MRDIFLWALILMIAPAIGAVLIPSVAEWFGAMLINHASGMRALYPGLRNAFRDYREAKGPAVTGVSQEFLESLDLDSLEHRVDLRKNHPPACAVFYGGACDC